MVTASSEYTRYTDGNGEEYYCPISAFSDGRISNDRAAEECVEATTAGRYSGNLEVADRFSPQESQEAS